MKKPWLGIANTENEGTWAKEMWVASRSGKGKKADSATETLGRNSVLSKPWVYFNEICPRLLVSGI